MPFTPREDAAGDDAERYTSGEQLAAMLDRVNASFDQLGQTTSAVADLTTDLVGNLQKLESETPDLSMVFNNLSAKMAKAEEAVAAVVAKTDPFKKIGDALAAVKDKTATAMSGAFGAISKIGGGIFSAFTIFFETLDKFVPIMDVLNGLLSILGAGVTEALMPAFQEFTTLLMNPQMIEFLTTLGNLIGSVLAVALEFLSEVLNALIESGVLDLITQGMQWLVGVLQTVADAMPEIWGAITKFFMEDIPAWAEGVAANWNAFWTNLGNGIANWFAEGLQGWNDFWSGIVNALLSGDFVQVLRNIVNGFLTAIEWFVNGFNDAVQFFDVFNVIPDFSISIPRLAQGGITNGPMIAMLGDNPSGHEKVTPLGMDGLSAGERALLAAMERNNDLVEMQLQSTRRATYF